MEIRGSFMNTERRNQARDQALPASAEHEAGVHQLLAALGS